MNGVTQEVYILGNVYHKILIGLLIALVVASLVIFVFGGRTDTNPIEFDEEQIEYDENVELELIMPELMYVGSTRQIRCFSSTIALFDSIILTINGTNHTSVIVENGLLSQYPYDFSADVQGTFEVTCKAYLDDAVIASKLGEIEVVDG